MAISDEVLTTAGPPRGLIAGTSFSIRAVWAHRELLNLLVKRELKSRYKDSSLGFVWSLIRPLTQLLIYFIAVGKFLGASDRIPDYAIYIFSGLTIWTLFSETIGTTTSSIVSNAGLVKKVYIPRELFPLAAMGSSIFNFLIQLGILLIAVFALVPAPFFGPEWWLIPMAVINMLLISLALGLMLSAANVFLRDIKHLIDVALLVLFWGSPIIYSFTLVHTALKGNILEQIYLWNPMTVAVIAFQKGMWRAGSADPKIEQFWPANMELRLLVCAVVSLLLVWIAQRIFARLEGNFAQEL